MKLEQCEWGPEIEAAMLAAYGDQSAWMRAAVEDGESLAFRVAGHGYLLLFVGDDVLEVEAVSGRGAARVLPLLQALAAANNLRLRIVSHRRGMDRMLERAGFVKKEKTDNGVAYVWVESGK